MSGSLFVFGTDNGVLKELESFACGRWGRFSSKKRPALKKAGHIGVEGNSLARCLD